MVKNNFLAEKPPGIGMNKASAAVLNSNVKKFETQMITFLAEKQKILSLRELKKIDRIEIKEPDKLHKQLMHDYPDEIQDFAFKIPFLKEGVVKYPAKSGGKTFTVYYHFVVDEVDYESQRVIVTLSAYHYADQMYTPEIKVTFKVEPHPDSSEYVMLSYDETSVMMKHNFYELIEPDRNSKVENAYYHAIVKYLKDKYNPKLVDRCLKDNIESFVSVIVDVNFLMEKQRQAKQNAPVPEKDISYVDSSEGRKAAKATKSPSNKRKEVHISSDITVIQGESSKIKVRRGFIVNRHTDVWGVKGHVRRYRSGKTVYIAPYKKGPGRKSNTPDGKTYKIHAAESGEDNAKK